MTKTITTTLIFLLCCMLVGAQPLVRQTPPRRSHHTHRLPGVNERRLARLEKMREANIALRHRKGPWRANTQPESHRGLVLLVEFSDVQMKSGAATQWNNRFNQQGFSQFNHVGSVSDYFRDQSYGLLNIEFDVVGPLELSHNHDYYGTPPNDNLDDRAPEMVIEALQLANPQVNYADYDWDGDGWVDQVYVIYAGITSDTESGYIWPHEWNLASAKSYGIGTGRQQMDGVYIDTYAVSNELANATTLEGIGTACHEFSHCLGYPDFYDTEYTGGTAAQFWDLLDGGSYNGPRGIGEIPCPYTAYERWTAGWIDLIPFTEACKVSDMPAINEEGVAYIIQNTGNKNEYYILENRQKKTFGKGNGGHGLMVWHIDYNQTVWHNNVVNSDKDHQRMTFLPADGSVGVLSQTYYGYRYDISANDEAGDPYPGLAKVDTVQQLTWYTSEKGGTRIHNNLIHHIKESSDGKISFIYGDCVVLPAPEMSAPTNVTGISFTANWLPVEGATSYTLQVEAMNSDVAAPATIQEEDFSKFIDVSANATITNSLLERYTQTSGWASSAIFGTGSPAVRISSANVAGHITTPALENKEGTLIVEFDAAYYSTDGSSVVVSILNGEQTVGTQTIPLTASCATYSCTFEDVPTGCKVRFASTAKRKRFYLYNVNIMDQSGIGSNIMTYTGLETTSFVIEQTGADMYYYRVQAVCEDGTSEWTEWMEVDMPSPVDEMPAFLAPEEGRGDIYDLSGRRLPSVPKQGVYIRNGKTYMVP